MLDPRLSEALDRLDRRLLDTCDAEERRAARLAGDGAIDGWDGVRNLVRPRVGELLQRVERSEPLVPEGAHPLNRIRAELGLHPAEQELLLLLLAPHVEARYSALFAVLNEEVLRPWVSERIALSVLGIDAEARRVLAVSLLPGGKLVASGLIRRRPEDVPLRDQLVLAPELVPLLQGASGFRIPHGTEVSLIAGRAEGEVAARFVVHGIGDARESARELVRGQMLHVVLPDDPATAVEATGAAWRIGLCLGITPVVEAGHLDDRGRRALQAAVAALNGLGGRLGVCTPEPLDLPIPHHDARRPGWVERRDAWEEAARRGGIALDLPGAERLAARWRHGPSTIRRIVEAAPQADERGLHALAATLGHRAVRHGIRVPTDRTFDDLVLRDTTRDALERLVFFVQNRDRVADERGLERRFRVSRGPVVLFSGVSGTGKTLAAEVVAGHLGRPMITVDLARLVSKYIGETEKHIDEVLRQGEDSAAVLFFDEADALFSARTEVSSSNDRFANLEVGYLLQRIERHDGLVILATNLRQSIDEAFLRRFQFRVEFPFPEPTERRRIWELMLPVEGLDLEDVARRHRLSGGNIRNAAIKAVFLAEQRGVALTRGLLREAVDLELLELGRLSRRPESGIDRGSLLRTFVEELQEHLEVWFRPRFLKEIHVIVGSPTKETMAGKQPAVSIALFRSALGRKGGLRLGFVISSFSHRAEEENELLGVVHDALAVLPIAAVLGHAVRARLQESHDFDLLHRFWSSHGHPVRASAMLDVEID